MSDNYPTATARCRETKNRTTFLIDACLIESVVQLPSEQAIAFFKMLADYVLYDCLPDTKTPTGIIAQQSVKQMEIEATHYLRTCERNRQNAKKSHANADNKNVSLDDDPLIKQLDEPLPW